MTLEKAMAPHSSTLAWKIPWMGEPGRLQSMGSRRVGHGSHPSRRAPAPARDRGAQGAKGRKSKHKSREGRPRQPLKAPRQPARFSASQRPESVACFPTPAREDGRKRLRLCLAFCVIYFIGGFWAARVGRMREDPSKQPFRLVRVHLLN